MVGQHDIITKESRNGAGSGKTRLTSAGHGKRTDGPTYTASYRDVLQTLRAIMATLTRIQCFFCKRKREKQQEINNSKQ